MVKHDLRIKKSKHAIKNAFWQLLMTNDLKQITIKQIISDANVNRTTFYNHYANKQELLSEIEDDLITKINSQALRDPNKVNLDSSPWQIHQKRVINTVYQNRTYIKVLIDNDDSQFLPKAIHQNRLFLREQNILKNIVIPENYVIEGLFGLASTLIYEWAKSNYRETPDEFFTIFQKMLQPILISNQIIKK